METPVQTLCDLDFQYGITIDVALLGLASVILLLKTLTDIPVAVSFISTLAVLGLLTHVLVRELHCKHRRPSSSPETPATDQNSAPTASSTAAAAASSTAAASPEEASTEPAPEGALGFWKDMPGLGGRRVAAPRCGRGYSSYIPGSEI